MAQEIRLTNKVGFSVFAGIIIIVLVLLGIGYAVSNNEISFEVGLPVLAITGVVLLLASLAIMSVTFALFGIGNSNHALGLPSGSIRAVIALSLIVLFGILSVYFYTSVASGPIERVSNLTDDEAASFRAGLDKDAFVGEIPPVKPNAGGSPATNDGSPGTPAGTTGAAPKDAPPPAGAAAVNAQTQGAKTVEPGKGPAAAKPLHTIYFKKGANAASIDLAKQLITLLGVLVTAISSFYFGSKSAAPSVEPADAQAKLELTTITPKNSGPLPQTLTLIVNGRNLATADHVKLKLETHEIGGTGVSSNASQVTATIALPDGTTPGVWDVVVSAKGTEYVLPKTFTVP